MLAACLVGLFALFRWIELTYGRYPAYGAIGGIMVVLAAICAGLAAATLRRPARKFPSLTSRLRVAIAAPVMREPPPSEVEPKAVSMAPATPRPGVARGRNAITVPVGLSVAALLLGWAAARRHQQGRSQQAAARQAPIKNN